MQNLTMGFSVRIENDIFPVIHLQDSMANCTAEIYSFGALLNAFTIAKNGVVYNVIDGFSSPADAQVSVTAGFKSAKLSPFVCRITAGQYTHAGEHFLINKFYLGTEAIHGLLFDAPFTVVETGADDKNAWAVLEYNYDKNDEGFPFQYNTRVTYSLKNSGALTITTAVTNTGKADMPLADGWHPYFTLGGTVNDLMVQINAEHMLEFNEKLVPTGNYAEHTYFATPKPLGETFFDNCFVVHDGGTPACTLKNEATGLQLSIAALTGYPYLQVYTPPHRKSIAVENLSSAPDAFNNGIGLIIAKPGKQYTFANVYTLQFDN